MVAPSRFAALAPAVVLAGLLGVVSPARAVPTVDLSWNNCSPIVASTSGPAGTYHLFASVTGQESGHQAYQVFVYVYDPGYSSLPDAWRFDAGGCQGSSRLEIRHLPPPFAAKACPAFHGTSNAIQSGDYTFNAATGRARFHLAQRYPGGVAAPNPSTRYFLLDAIFDHAHSVVGRESPGVTCGGFERDIVFSLDSTLGCGYACEPVRSIWMDQQGVEHDFAVGQETVTFCGSCAPVPIRAATWGGIKGAYRR